LSTSNKDYDDDDDDGDDLDFDVGLDSNSHTFVPDSGVLPTTLLWSFVDYMYYQSILI